MIPTNWCRACGAGANFGDQLTPALLEHFGIPFEWAPPAQAELVVVGSILSKLPDRWAGTVLGTGLIRQGIRRDLSRARVLAIRGQLTRDACRLPVTTPLGDLGLLVPDLVDTPVHGGVLVVPHYVDHVLAGRHPEAAVLDIRTEPREFIRRVAGASLVYTSSLHALIAADALGVPWQLEPHADVHGGLWKFNDYASALGERRIVVGRPTLSNRAAVADRQSELRESIITLGT